MIQTNNLHFFGLIPFVKLQNDTKTTVKRFKTMKNEIRKEITFCCGVGVGGGGGVSVCVCVCGGGGGGVFFFFSAWKNIHLLFKCRFVVRRRGLVRKFANCVSVS